MTYFEGVAAVLLNSQVRGDSVGCQKRGISSPKRWASAGSTRSSPKITGRKPSVQQVMNKPARG